MSQAGRGEPRILSVGMACADLVSVVKTFPTEDLLHNCLDQYWQRGGNASNNCTVLSLLGTPCEFLGTLSTVDTSHEARFITEDLLSHNIEISQCVYHDGVRCPLSANTISRQNGSRTILHSPGELPELTAEEFRRLDLEDYCWIHFEGRPASVLETRAMLQHVDEYNTSVGSSKRIPTSVELEQSRAELVGLEDTADYVFLSKEHCDLRGFKNKEDASEAILKSCRDRAAVICAWGDTGSIVRTQDGDTFTAPIFAPDTVVDTLGAGDTFIAGTILTLCRGGNLQDAILFGSKLAGAKVGMQGFSGLKSFSTR